MDRFFAHSTPNPNQAQWQLLSHHLVSTGRRAHAFAEHFGAGPLADVAGMLHDLGKYTDEFQQRLKGGPRVDHATWGARIAIDRYGAMGRLLAYGIAGHHTGLANGRDRDEGDRTPLAERLAASLPLLKPQWEHELSLPADPLLLQPTGFTPIKEIGFFQLALLARMLFSCLVDADYQDTEAFYAAVEGRAVARGEMDVDLASLRERLNQKLSGFSADTDVNRIRAHILAGIRGRSTLPPGLFSLTVPTGGGKTLASLAFALDHALAHGLRRVIYVIPFTSIVEQTATVFREVFGDLGDRAVLEHHSAFVESKSDPEARDKLNLAMENWDAPIVVTTSVQFFESLYGDRPSQVRKLHNIAASVVILDEAQTLPLKLLRPCVAVIDELARNYRASLVLCTATQPALDAPVFERGLRDVRELAPEPKALFTELKRVHVIANTHSPMDDDAVAAMLRENDQVLCIVNNRRHARALFEAIDGAPGACHLTTMMCARHRSEVLAKVKRVLSDGAPCRLVATSLIEAGVDVDFPFVMRAEAGLESIAQAAGRCNREGLHPADQSKVLVFATDQETWPPPPELRQYAQVAREILRQHEDPLTLEAINQYFEHLYWQKGKELDAHDLLRKIEEGRLDGLPFATLARHFRMIDSDTLPVIVPYGDEDHVGRALRDLTNGARPTAIARRLQPFVVQVSRWLHDALRQVGAVQPFEHYRFGDQFQVLQNIDLYHWKLGLCVENPAFMKPGSGVW